MRDDDTFHMNSTTCPGVIGIKPTCEGNCCLFLTFDDFKDAKIRAKEVKTAASAIMSECYSGKKRNLEKRILPAVLAIAAAWNMVAVAQIFGVVVGALAGALAAIFKLVFNDDDERRAFVLKTLDEAAKAAPEYNIIIAHTEHTYEFDDLHHHEHVEFDRPDPWGTFGYEIYHARTGNFELKGDGDYINWAWSGYITPDKDNSKKLTLYAPGVKYGAASINGQYTAPNGATTKLSMGIGLGNSSGCITCFV
ncbi:hypothetical protein BDN72DRAFT_624259 [Pluteus cervinus]|uniref:Uncharacterized protein n=1 Tax=Pluteus cervinus TaxID=181527 RepID=A0ACD3AV97_9AGAR|nr:hypothetical protein BDN72DRAFT_624259 [Pluteus cervinus]